MDHKHGSDRPLVDESSAKGSGRRWSPPPKAPAAGGSFSASPSASLRRPMGSKNQMFMFCLESAIASDSFVRVVDAFVDAIDLKSFGFAHVECQVPFYSGSG